MLVSALMLVASPDVVAQGPADQVERARLLRQMDQPELPPVLEPRDARALPGARIEIDALRARERLQSRQRENQLWRQTLGEQQAGKIRQEMSGIPSTGPAVRAMGAERDHRMQDLSSRILQQDLQYRLDH
jgi:hypothetical protein